MGGILDTRPIVCRSDGPGRLAITKNRKEASTGLAYSNPGIHRPRAVRVLEKSGSAAIVDEPTLGIDTPEDYKAFVECRQAG